MVLLCSYEVVNVIGSPLNVALDVNGEARCFWDGESEKQSKDARNTTKTDEEPPHEVDVPQIIGVIRQKRFLVCTQYCNSGDGCSCNPSVRSMPGVDEFLETN